MAIANPVFPNPRAAQHRLAACLVGSIMILTEVGCSTYWSDQSKRHDQDAHPMGAQPDGDAADRWDLLAREKPMQLGSQESKTQRGVEPGDLTSSEEPSFQMHDAGHVLAGEVIRHLFSFQNTTSHSIQLPSDESIRKSCGCTQATIASRTLAPGQATALTVVVDTRAKRGPLQEVVNLDWTDDKGRSYRYGFGVRAVVDAAILWDPPEILFEKGELRSGCTKRVECLSDLACDWSRAVLQPEADYLRVVRREVVGQGRLVLDIECTPSGSGEHRVTNLEVRVPRQMISPQNAESPTEELNADRTVFTARLPVHSADLANLKASPRMPVLRYDAEEQSWRCRMIVTGDSVTSGARISTVRSSMGRVRFDSVMLGPHAVRCDVNLQPLAEGELMETADRKLVIRMSDGEELLVPVILPSAHSM